MKERKFRRIWGKPWDWYYLLNLERCKIREIRNHINKTRRFVGYQTVLRDMQICIKLIDIVLEEDAPYKSWLHQDYEKPFSKHINVKNANRFLKPVNYVADPDSRIYQDLLVEYRKVKALALYNKIRTYKIFSWWD